jgi:peptidoglycan/xylan/chitin deacetylase (PgdA/CDA1 family)
MYHRIADEPIDPWGLAVSPARFEEHLRVLRRTRHPFPLIDFVGGLLAGTLPSNAVALTFDDGYVDNLVSGKPQLAAADVPATVFLTTGSIDRSESFWWDELARLILFGGGPQFFEIVIQNNLMRFDFGTEAAACEDGSTPVASLKERHASLWTIWQTLRRLDDDERGLTMVKLRSIFKDRGYRSGLSRAMTSDEVRALVTDGLVTIGAHTVTHPELSRLGTAACRREIAESKLACEALIGSPIVGFSYPYGDFDAEVRELVKTAGFTFACSMQRVPVIAKSEIFTLPRLHIPNLDGDAFERTLRSASAVH